MGESNSLRPATSGVCTSPFAGSFFMLTSLGGGVYTLNFNCTDITCTSCFPAFNVTLGLCIPDPTSSNHSFYLSASPCVGALTNPAVPSLTSLSVVWSNNSASCSTPTHGEVVTYGSVSTSVVCVPYLYNTSYTWVQQLANGNYSGGLFCNAGCTGCNITYTNVALRTCNSNAATGSSFSIVPTGRLPTCYTMPTTLFLSHVHEQ